MIFRLFGHSMQAQNTRRYFVYCSSQAVRSQFRFHFRVFASLVPFLLFFLFFFAFRLATADFLFINSQLIFSLFFPSQQQAVLKR